MKKVLVLCLVLCLGLFCLVGCGGGNDDAQSGDASLTIKDGVFMVGMEIGYPPFEYYAEDGVTPTGFDVELAAALAEEMGMTVEYVDTAWDGIFEALNVDKYDAVISAASMIPERVEAYGFSKAYIGNAQCIVLPKDSTISVANGMTDLAGLSVAYQAETISDQILTEMIEAGEVACEVFEYDKVLNCFDDLANGRVDSVLCDLTVGLSYITNPRYEVTIAWQGETDDTMGVCMKKTNTELIAKVDEALAAVRESGKLGEIATKYFGDTTMIDLVAE